MTTRREKAVVCAVPDCNRPLRKDARSNVCREHNHNTRWCNCRTCTARRGKQARVCAIPGCRAKISDENISGLCRQHMHTTGYCKCRSCMGIAMPPEHYEPLPERTPDVTSPLLVRLSRPGADPREVGKELAAIGRRLAMAEGVA